MCDQATQHTSQKIRKIRDEWCKQHNVAPLMQMSLLCFELVWASCSFCKEQVAFQVYACACASRKRGEVFLTGDTEESIGCSIPGGYGACGQPNDGFHSFLHLLNRSYCKIALNWGTSLELRQSLDGLNLGVQASVSTKKLGFSLANVDVFQELGVQKVRGLH